MNLFNIDSVNILNKFPIYKSLSLLISHSLSQPVNHHRLNTSKHKTQTCTKMANRKGQLALGAAIAAGIAGYFYTQQGR
jgi:hypothetical protein